MLSHLKCLFLLIFIFYIYLTFVTLTVTRASQGLVLPGDIQAMIFIDENENGVFDGSDFEVPDNVGATVEFTYINEPGITKTLNIITRSARTFGPTGLGDFYNLTSVASPPTAYHDMAAGYVSAVIHAPGQSYDGYALTFRDVSQCNNNPENCIGPAPITSILVPIDGEAFYAIPFAPAADGTLDLRIFDDHIYDNPPINPRSTRDKIKSDIGGYNEIYGDFASVTIYDVNSNPVYIGAQNPSITIPSGNYTVSVTPNTGYGKGESGHGEQSGFNVGGVAKSYTDIFTVVSGVTTIVEVGVVKDYKLVFDTTSQTVPPGSTGTFNLTVSPEDGGWGASDVNVTVTATDFNFVPGGPVSPTISNPNFSPVPSGNTDISITIPPGTTNGVYTSNIEVTANTGANGLRLHRRQISVNVGQVPWAQAVNGHVYSNSSRYTGANGITMSIPSAPPQNYSKFLASTFYDALGAPPPCPPNIGQPLNTCLAGFVMSNRGLSVTSGQNALSYISPYDAPQYSYPNYNLQLAEDIDWEKIKALAEALPGGGPSYNILKDHVYTLGNNPPAGFQYTIAGNIGTPIFYRDGDLTISNAISYLPAAVVECGAQVITFVNGDLILTSGVGSATNTPRSINDPCIPSTGHDLYSYFIVRGGIRIEADASKNIHIVGNLIAFGNSGNIDGIDNQRVLSQPEYPSVVSTLSPSVLKYPPGALGTPLLSIEESEHVRF